MRFDTVRNNPVDVRHSLVAYGHSWVDGDGASQLSRKLVQSAARDLGLELDNRAVGGSSSKETAILLSAEPSPRADIYLLMTGLNDARLHGLSSTGLQEYASAISRILRTFRKTSPDALVVAVEQPHLIDYSRFPPHNHGSDRAVDLYNAILKRATDDDSNALYVRAPQWNPLTMLSADTVHPNDFGHAYLAQEIVAAINNSSGPFASNPARSSEETTMQTATKPSSGNDLTSRVRELLEVNWVEELGYCVPNHETYPHLWLWDSCFHAIIWAHLGDERALRELDSVLQGQLNGGLVPHMRFGKAGSDTWLGPLAGTSSLAQPPMFGHAIRVLTDHGMRPSSETLDQARAGIEWLWDNRRTKEGLIFVVHPWEAGNDHGPRWDDWGAPGRTPEDYNRPARTAWNKERVFDISFAADGAAIWSSTFVVCPAAFNAYVAFNMHELASVLQDDEMSERADILSKAIDEFLWDPDEKLWHDRAVVGGGASTTIPISDGVMGALVTHDREKAEAALTQLDDPDRFAARFGPANVARSHPAYDPETYWRGPAWPPLNYLFWLAQHRWNRTSAADQLANETAQAAEESGWAEYWNPDTGRGLGAIPQTWTGLVIAMNNRLPES